MAGVSRAACPSARWDSTRVPSSRTTGSIAAACTITASWTADATSITCCSDPNAPAHCASDPRPCVVGKAPASSPSTAAHTACT